MQHVNVDPRAMRTAVSGLIKAVSREGVPDRYPGKRRATRVAEGMMLEMTTDPTQPMERQTVTLHNISPDGFAFWSRSRITVRSIIFLRPVMDRNPNPWINGRVTHCTSGLRGFLVGGRFEYEPAAASRPRVATTRP